MTPQTLLSGFRPTGRLHLGHLHGTLKNWVRLQATYRSFFFVADWHALTTSFEETGGIAQSTREMVADWLAVGLDPERSVIFRQSAILEHAELFLIFAMITPTPWLLRNPTVKEQARELGLIASDDEAEMTKINFGHLGYPVLQAADILMYRGEPGARGRRSGAARRVHARAGAALQPSLPAGVSRAGGAAQRGAEDRWPRRTEDEQELQQRGVPLGADRRRRGQARQDDDGSAPGAAHGPRRSQGLSRLPELYTRSTARRRSSPTSTRAARAPPSAAWSARRS